MFVLKVVNVIRRNLYPWCEIVLGSLVMGLSILCVMLALEYLVTGTFGAAREYAAIASAITLALTYLQGRRFYSRRQSTLQPNRAPKQI
jgi:membrane protein implicated in regulation of membrane protease activity